MHGACMKTPQHTHITIDCMAAETQPGCWHPKPLVQGDHVAPACRPSAPGAAVRPTRCKQRSIHTSQRQCADCAGPEKTHKTSGSGQRLPISRRPLGGALTMLACSSISQPGITTNHGASALLRTRALAPGQQLSRQALLAVANHSCRHQLAQPGMVQQAPGTQTHQQPHRDPARCTQASTLAC